MKQLVTRLTVIITITMQAATRSQIWRIACVIICTHNYTHLRLHRCPMNLRAMIYRHSHHRHLHHRLTLATILYLTLQIWIVITTIITIMHNHFYLQTSHTTHLPIYLASLTKMHQDKPRVLQLSVIPVYNSLPLRHRRKLPIVLKSHKWPWLKLRRYDLHVNRVVHRCRRWLMLRSLLVRRWVHYSFMIMRMQLDNCMMHYMH